MRNRGTAEGTEEEINFVKLLNRKEDMALWETLNLDSKTHYAIGKKSPKILIYIFKDKGLWSSQVLIELKDQVVKNALQIKKRNNKTWIGKAYNKDWLWYGSTK